MPFRFEKGIEKTTIFTARQFFILLKLNPPATVTIAGGFCIYLTLCVLYQFDIHSFTRCVGDNTFIK